MGEILSELQLLLAMYEPSQVHFDDPEVALKIENGVPIFESISLTLKLNPFLKLNLRIPVGYPDFEKLSACCDTNKSQELNASLNTWLKEDKDGTANNILGVINWVNEQWEEISTQTTSSNIIQEESPKLCRIWIHSHHIYNEKKRKFIVDTASNLDLNGFSLPGKPGFICVEGLSENADKFWSQVRQLTWQKIGLIDKQMLEAQEDQVFTKFEELLIDKSSFMKYLDERNISSVIKDYLGLK